MEDSESQILEPLERESVDSTSVISPTKADSEMKGGNIREASWRREARFCGSAMVQGGVAGSEIEDDDNLDCDFDCFFLLLLLSFELEDIIERACELSVKYLRRKRNE